MHMPTILLVEDDLSLRETLAYNLQKQDYRVETASNGQAAVEAARRLHPDLDLVVLDIMLPILDGFEVCRLLRKEMSVPIIMLTARDDEIDRVIGWRSAPTITSPSPSACANSCRALKRTCAVSGWCAMN
jgi:DNA-binding response OmpR family regulator